MFSLDVVDTDNFLDMPASTQALYFQLGMRADDDGFVSSPRKITRNINCSNDDLKLLITKGYIIPFDSGICVVRDWKINNNIRTDRYKPTIYQQEKALLLNDSTVGMTNGIPIDIPTVATGKDSIGKDSIDKTSIDKGSIGKGECERENGFASYSPMSEDDFEKNRQSLINAVETYSQRKITC
jgi:hypothetical protein